MEEAEIIEKEEAEVAERAEVTEKEEAVVEREDHLDSSSKE